MQVSLKRSFNNVEISGHIKFNNNIVNKLNYYNPIPIYIAPSS